MLQPLQIKDVAVRYAKEIAELRDFLVKAGSAVETAGALGDVVARLPQDRAFHRDLTSHVWVLLHGGDRQVSISDLLGVVTIAAAGPQFAAAAEEKDAHDLLRFLMEARRSLDMASDQRELAPIVLTTAPAVAVPVQPVEPFRTARESGQDIYGAPGSSSSAERHFLETPPEQESKRRRVFWVAAVACLLIALSIGVWLTHRPAAAISNTPVSAPPAPTETPQPAALAERGEASSSLSSSEVMPQTVMRSVKEKSARQTPAPSIPAHPTDISPRPTTANLRGPVSTQAMGSVPTPAWTATPSTSPVTPLPAPRAAGSAKSTFAGVPSATLSKNLGSRSIPTDSSLGYDSAASNRPRLLRRRPLTPSSSLAENDTNLVAEVRPANGSAASGTSSTGSANTNRVGTVRPTSLGIMAAYVQYSPVPMYPAAASAAHVQGEVTVRADVDREGNVASARVISGPPLLRDAALDAVQHWRYRPYISSGKAAPMTATAVMDFQLSSQ